ncbi:MAG: L-seryl-tRNA(Sec) selenium transferase [Anaerolineales bacterium]|nr:L-seryl-tRNA(Sec) selenium transferase [Chloroflexota bacterium]MBL6983616.1 L-seryl-tRNA(Sec) selenium transferase [Anaerolineales bacterium]
MSDLRHLPSVDKLIQSSTGIDWIAEFGRPLAIDAIRVTLDDLRAGFNDGVPLPSQSDLLQMITNKLQYWVVPTLQSVVNASGVIIHTNLGRAPMSKAALQAAQQVSSGYSNLEYDLGKGQRGSRTVHAENLLIKLTGAEAGLVVNNNAAAVLLALSTIANRRRVVIARSQLVEIGGGFRIPDVMKQSGAKLVEIGTTNRVHLRDYQQAFDEQPIKLVMRAHRSNFALVGFTTEPELREIVSAAHAAEIPVLDDLGSGTLLDTSEFGLAREPMVSESLDAGADLVCFSGDKLLGGPQAGIIIGRGELIAKLKKHPLARAVRSDKMALASLSATLTHYLKDEALREIPIWHMISADQLELQERAQDWVTTLKSGKVIPGESTVGGGSLPGESMPTSLLALDVSHPDRFLKRLRENDPPIIGRIQDDMAVFDPRTVFPEQDEILLNGIQTNLGL